MNYRGLARGRSGCKRMAEKDVIDINFRTTGDTDRTPCVFFPGKNKKMSGDFVLQDPDLVRLICKHAAHEHLCLMERYGYTDTEGVMTKIDKPNSSVCRASGDGAKACWDDKMRENVYLETASREYERARLLIARCGVIMKRVCRMWCIAMNELLQRKEDHLTWKFGQLFSLSFSDVENALLPRLVHCLHADKSDGFRLTQLPVQWCLHNGKSGTLEKVVMDARICLKLEGEAVVESVQWISNSNFTAFGIHGLYDGDANWISKCGATHVMDRHIHFLPFELPHHFDDPDGGLAFYQNIKNPDGSSIVRKGNTMPPVLSIHGRVQTRRSMELLAKCGTGVPMHWECMDYSTTARTAVSTKTLQKLQKSLTHVEYVAPLNFEMRACVERAGRGNRFGLYERVAIDANFSFLACRAFAFFVDTPQQRSLVQSARCHLHSKRPDSQRPNSHSLSLTLGSDIFKAVDNRFHAHWCIITPHAFTVEHNHAVAAYETYKAHTDFDKFGSQHAFTQALSKMCNDLPNSHSIWFGQTYFNVPPDLLQSGQTYVNVPSTSRNRVGGS